MLDAGLILGLGGALGGALMAALAFAMSRAPGWRELRSFAFVALAAAAYCACALVHVLPVTEPVLLIGERCALAACFAYGLLWIRHLAIAQQRALVRWERAVLAIGALLVVAALIPGWMITLPARQVTVGWLGVTYTMATPTTLALIGIVFVIGAMVAAAFGGGRRWRDGWAARLPMICACVLVVAAVLDTLGALGVVAAPQLIEATSIAIVGVLAAAYTRRFVADARRLEALSARLEQAIAVRTDDLVEAQARAEQHERLAALGRIAAGVAHEVNNPAAVVLHNLDRMRTLVAAHAEGTPGALGELAERIARSRAATERIVDIVRQLLAAWRPASTDAPPSACAIVAVVERAVVAARVVVPGLEVRVAIDPALCAHVDAAALEQVVINLLVNAAHATAAMPARRRVHVEAARDGAHVRLAVLDNGPGIPAEVRGRLFEPFATTKPIGQGTGLGLAVARALVTRYGGSLAVGRSSEAGTEMVIELPAAERAEPADRAAPAPPPEPLPDAPPAPGAPALRVLVIEDDADLREVLGLQLELFYRVEEASTVEQALAMARGGAYDIVLCDLMMPGGGAESWFARCDAIDPSLDARTIVLTGGPTTEGASALLHARAGRVLIKPVEIAELRAMMARIVAALPAPGAPAARADDG